MALTLARFLFWRHFIGNHCSWHQPPRLKNFAIATVMKQHLSMCDASSSWRHVLPRAKTNNIVECENSTVEHCGVDWFESVSTWHCFLWLSEINASVHSLAFVDGSSFEENGSFADNRSTSLTSNYELWKNYHKEMSWHVELSTWLGVATLDILMTTELSPTCQWVRCFEMVELRTIQ